MSKTLEMARYLRRMMCKEDLSGVPNPFEETGSAASASKPSSSLAADVAKAIEPKAKAVQPKPERTLAADIAAFFRNDDEPPGDTVKYFSSRDE